MGFLGYVWLFRSQMKHCTFYAVRLENKVQVTKGDTNAQGPDKELLSLHGKQLCPTMMGLKIVLKKQTEQSSEWVSEPPDTLTSVPSLPSSTAPLRAQKAASAQGRAPPNLRSILTVKTSNLPRPWAQKVK